MAFVGGCPALLPARAPVGGLVARPSAAPRPRRAPTRPPPPTAVAARSDAEPTAVVDADASAAASPGRRLAQGFLLPAPTAVVAALLGMAAARVAATGVTLVAGAAVGVTAVALPSSTKRYREVSDIPSSAFGAGGGKAGGGAATVLSAFVTDVAGGASLRVRHTPLRMPGSAANDPAIYFERRAAPWDDPDALPRGMEGTLPVRLGGVKVPDGGLVDKAGQPLGEEAKAFVADLLVKHGGGSTGGDDAAAAAAAASAAAAAAAGDGEDEVVVVTAPPPSGAAGAPSAAPLPRGVGAAVRVSLLAKDRAGRLVGTVWVGPPWAPVNVSTALLAAGLAVVDRRAGAAAAAGGWGVVYERAEADAKARRAGLWAGRGGGRARRRFVRACARGGGCGGWRGGAPGVVRAPVGGSVSSGGGQAVDGRRVRRRGEAGPLGRQRRGGGGGVGRRRPGAGRRGRRVQGDRAARPCRSLRAFPLVLAPAATQGGRNKRGDWPLGGGRRSAGQTP
ncbi:hypothetical protein BU14_0397s0005 [Porphyra umbilicalis]|uniref:TNase-like domain-containing protein n=1 Tax=Porphyra umbilicalis TaxID=2786 RepID=A0A1X6NW86_PORUM|nr:hypothetical protein BU14_0397s0005 [Porphyra umbilicalis]|eukprot:OSX72881.1 hypothetical protein BU14_0397s0005 [Porphyra umbilicalis]